MWKPMLFTLAILLLPAFSPTRTTWADKEVDCPVCETKNTFQTPASWGSYIYRWPSKYQYIFWPTTHRNFIYTCSSCRLSMYMWDFEKFPKEKFKGLEKKLTALKMDEAEHYYLVPMSQRLAAAEITYTALKKDEEFWCKFYRIKGYHLDAEGNEEGAKEARGATLETLTQMMDDKTNAARKKELLFTAGSMRHFMGESKAALADLEAAAKLTYGHGDAKQAKNLDTYLSEVIEDFITQVKAGEGPGKKPEK